MSNKDVMAVNAIRVLSADAIQKANSGHPGLPLGSAPMAYELWANHLKHNPKDPEWFNRDRFILSGGHGSAMLYSLLHLFGYGLTLEDLKNFRQFGSKTPGHPEYGHTVGVEATTGPLGAGMAMAVGMAIAEKHLAAKFNREGYPVVDHYTFALGGEGCLMEGISSEAFSLAGTLGLDKLIILFDSNNITIEGSTNLAFTENVAKRMEAFGFQTLTVEDGTNLEEIGKAIEEAKADKTRPSFITVRTEIGYGCPAKQGKASAHGEPLGQENVDAMKDTLGWPSHEPFYVPDEVYTYYKEMADSKAKAEEDWNKMFDEYCKAYPDMAEEWKREFSKDAAKELINDNEYWAPAEKPEATRASSGVAINRLKDHIPSLIGGSADLAPSNKTEMTGVPFFSKETPEGRNIHFGIRELAMAAIGNGMVLHGLSAYVATFLVFSDYMKPMARLSALMKIPTTFVLTHDSIGVGEDGPTHEPIEQLAMLRAMPNFNVFRPADRRETLAAWYSAMTSETTPTAIALTRQNLPQVSNAAPEDILKGAYIISDSKNAVPEVIVIATGSEVSLALEAKKMVEDKIDVRVVSMPCMDLFEAQSEEYKQSILPDGVKKRIAVEALSAFGWEKYTGLDGKIIAMRSFGASAPAGKLFEHFGFIPEAVADAIKEIVK